MEAGKNTNISIEADRTHWLAYDNNNLVISDPIKLNVKHNFKEDWKPKTLDWFLVSGGQIEGISLINNFAEDLKT